MSEPTQSVGGPASDDEGAGSPIGAPPVAYLRVFAQKDLEERDWPVTEGESTVGRDAECSLCLEAKSLSRCHASFLVEDGGHFLKDLGSRNRTYRKNIPLRSHTYYELTNGCELILADIRCQYFIGKPPEGEEPGEGEKGSGEGEEGPGEGEEGPGEGEGPGEREGAGEGEGPAGADYEQTQMYSFDVEEEDDGDGDGDGEPSSARPMADQTVPMDSEGSTVGEEAAGEGGTEGVDVEATQAYGFGAGVEDEESEGGRSEGGGSEGVMDCEPTVAYHVGDVNPSEDADSPASSPLLVGKPPSSPRPQPKAERKVCFGQTVLYDDEDSAITGDEGGASGEATPPTDAEASASSKESSSRDRKSKESSEAAAGASKPGAKRVGFEQPILPTDPDEQTLPYVAGDGGSETDSAGQRGEEPMEVEPTVAYELAGNSDDTDVTVAEEGDGGRGDVEPTVAYQLEDNPEDTAEGSVAADTTMAGVSTADSEETTDGGGGEGRGNVEPTVPYFLEESKEEGGSEDRTEPSAAGEDGRGGGESGTRTVDEGRKGEPDSQSSDSDLDVSIPAAGDVGKHSRQKTLFGRQSSRRRRGGKGGRGRGRGRGRTARDGGSPVPEPGPSITSKGTRRGRGRRRISSDDGFPDPEPGPSDPTEGTRRGRGKGKTASDGSPIPEPGPTDTAEGSKRGRETKAKRSSRTVVMETATEPSSSELAADAPPTTTMEQSGPSGEESSGSRGRSRRGRSKQMRGTPSKVELDSHKSTPARSEVAAPTSPAVEATTASVPPTTTPTGELSDESPDISIPSGRSPVAGLSTPVKKEDLLVSPASSSTGSISTAGSQGSKGSRGGGRGKGRGGRGAGVSTPKKGRAAKPSIKSESTSTLRPKGTPEHPPSPPPRVLFTGVVDKEGERTLWQLGGELVHSVYECTHLVTDKVRRTVKFLCCLSRGCHLVSTGWLDQCRSQRRLLPPEPFTIKDRSAERQHSFSLNRSLQSARLARVLSDYKVFLTPNVRPECKDMVDIIKCSGGEVLSSLPHTPGEGVIIVTCESDLSMCRTAMEAGVPVHSTELILGGVLKQELDLHCHLMSCDPSSTSSTSASGSTRKRKGREPAGAQPASKRRKKG